MFYFLEARDRLNSANVYLFRQTRAELVLHLPVRAAHRLLGASKR